MRADGRRARQTGRLVAAPPTRRQLAFERRSQRRRLADLHVHDVDFAQYPLGLPATITAGAAASPADRPLFATYSYADAMHSWR